MKNKIRETLCKSLQISDMKTQRVHTRHYLNAKWHAEARRIHKLSVILFSEAICCTKPRQYRVLTCIRGEVKGEWKFICDNVCCNHEFPSKCTSENLSVGAVGTVVRWILHVNLRLVIDRNLSWRSSTPRHSNACASHAAQCKGTTLNENLHWNRMRQKNWAIIKLKEWLLNLRSEIFPLSHLKV
jgi:hypothetical protein